MNIFCFIDADDLYYKAGLSPYFFRNINQISNLDMALALGAWHAARYS
jgi:hypothetical protein